MAKIDAFWERCERAQCFEEVAGAVYDVAGELGFTYASYLCLAPANDNEPVRFANYPASFFAEYRTNRLDRFDHITRRACTSSEPFLWRDPAVLEELNAKQIQLLRSFERYGLREGYAVPINGSLYVRAACFFATADPEISPEAQAASRLAAVIAHEHVARILALGRAHQKLDLTDRERDCLNLWASGRSDVEIASELGIAAMTVRRHLRQAQARLSANSRREAIVQGILTGQITGMRF